MSRLGIRVLLIGSLLIGCWVGLLGLSWTAGDSITQARIEAKWILLTHVLFGREHRFNDWLSQYQGEAASAEAMNVLVEWSIAYPNYAETTLAKLPMSEQISLSTRVAWSVVDRGLKEQFNAAFSQSQIPVFSLARQQIATGHFKP